MNSNLQSIDSLVVRCPNWVGDIVMATPVFECLRSNFPNAKITAFVRPYARGILEDSPWFDNIINCNDKSFAGLNKIRTEMKSIQPDAGLLLTNTTHSFLTFKFASVPKIYGYKLNLRKPFLSDGPTPEKSNGDLIAIPMQQYYLNLCRFFDLSIPEKPRPSLFMSERLSNLGTDLLHRYGIDADDKVIGINPGASFGSSKCWPTQNFAKLCDLLQSAHQCKILLFAGPGEESIADNIEQSSNAKIINTAPDKIDLALLKPLIKRCDLLVTNDTGPRQYAVAFRVPSVVLMGPTNRLFTEANMEMTDIIQRDLPCVPCHKKICPLKHHACMVEITPQMVLERANAVLAGTTGAAV